MAKALSLLPLPLFRRFLGPGISRVPQFEEEEGGRGCQNGGCIIPLSVPRRRLLDKNPLFFSRSPGLYLVAI